MKKVFSLLLVTLLTGCIFILTGCGNSSKKETVSNIKLNEEQYIDQLVPVKINNTNDTVTITSEVKWNAPKEADGNTTVSFSIAIPYTITIDGKDYTGVYQLNDSAWSVEDENPKYNFEVKNLTKDGDISVYITLK